MAAERIDLRAFLAETLEQLGSAIPDRVVFTCQIGETPDVHADRVQLRRVIVELVSGACALSSEVNVRTGTVAGRSGPHAFVEVSRPDSGTRFIVPIPVFRPTDMRLAGIEPATSRSGGARSIP
jgi:hypothetical protein